MFLFGIWSVIVFIVLFLFLFFIFFTLWSWSWSFVFFLWSWAWTMMLFFLLPSLKIFWIFIHLYWFKLSIIISYKFKVFLIYINLLIYKSLIIKKKESLQFYFIYKNITKMIWSWFDCSLIEAPLLQGHSWLAVIIVAIVSVV